MSRRPWANRSLAFLLFGGLKVLTNLLDFDRCFIMENLEFIVFLRHSDAFKSVILDTWLPNLRVHLTWTAALPLNDGIALERGFLLGGSGLVFLCGVPFKLLSLTF